MGWFNRGKAEAALPKERVIAVRRAQTKDPWEREIIGRLQGYIPLRGDLDLYDLIRELSPIADVAVLKLVRLIGDFRLDAQGNTAARKVLDDTKKSVKVGWFDGGFSSYMNQLSDSAIAKGFGIGELVPDVMLRGIDRLKVARANDFRFIDKDGRLVLGQLDKYGFRPVEMQNPSLIHYLAFDLRDGHPQGVSMYASIPSIFKTLLRIQRAIDSTVWRIGDPTFLVLREGGVGETASDVSASVGRYLDDLQDVMVSRKAGGLVDLGFGYPNDGDAQITVLGSDVTLPDMSNNIKSTMEQIIAKTGLPPFMFGLSWSTTERMAKEQSDMLTSDIWSWRARLDPIIERVFTTALILAGMNGVKWSHEWYPVNLQDDQKTAQARHLNAAAQEKEINARLTLLDAGLINIDSFISFLVEQGIESEESIKAAGGSESISKRYMDAKGVKIALAIARESV